MHFKFYGSEIDIESKDWLTMQAPQYTLFKVGSNSIEITPSGITITGNVTVTGSMDVSGNVTASGISEG